MARTASRLLLAMAVLLHISTPSSGQQLATRPAVSAASLPSPKTKIGMLTADDLSQAIAEKLAGWDTMTDVQRQAASGESEAFKQSFVGKRVVWVLRVNNVERESQSPSLIQERNRIEDRKRQIHEPNTPIRTRDNRQHETYNPAAASALEEAHNERARLSQESDELSGRIARLTSFPYTVTGTAGTVGLPVIAMVGVESKKILDNVTTGDEVTLTGVIESISTSASHSRSHPYSGLSVSLSRCQCCKDPQMATRASPTSQPISAPASIVLSPTTSRTSSLPAPFSPSVAAAQVASAPTTSKPVAIITVLSGTFQDLATIRQASDADSNRVRSLIEHTKLPVGNGIWMQEVLVGSPADKAGIKPKDVIVSIASIDTPSKGALGLLSPKLGQKYPVVLWRLGLPKDNVLWQRMTVTVVADREDSCSAAAVASRLKEWENQQMQIDPEHRPYELKGDRLGMTFEMFKGKYHRAIPNDSSCAPCCSDDHADIDNPSLLYRGEYAKAGIVHARTTFPFEETGTSANKPTIAGAPAQQFVYKFVDGQLYEITIFFEHKDFDQVMAALKVKYGQPSGKDGRTYQNPFGASFSGEVVLWSNAASEMTILERAGKLDQSLLVLTHKALSRIAADRMKAAVRPRTDDL